MTAKFYNTDITEFKGGGQGNSNKAAVQVSRNISRKEPNNYEAKDEHEYIFNSQKGDNLQEFCCTKKNRGTWGLLMKVPFYAY